MKPSPYLIQADSSGQTLYPIKPQKGHYNEAWLQELLRQHPDILPVDEIEPIYSSLVPIGVEVGTQSGSIDNLFISHRGYLVLVETKLWRNPQAKREVVAQAMDYASALTRWPYDKLDAAARKYTTRYEGQESSLVDWVESQLGPVEGRTDFFEETVVKNLRLGRFLTMIVGDRVRRSVVDMLAYVNKYPHMATDVALVELRCFQWQKDDEWPLLVVPAVVAKTEIVERSVVQVTVRQAAKPEIDVQQEKGSEKGTDRARVSLTEEAFWELLGDSAPASRAAMKRLIDHYRGEEGVVIDPMQSSLVVRLNLQPSGQRLSLVIVDQQGWISFIPKVMRSQLRRAGLDDTLVSPYEQRMRQVMRVVDASRKELYCRPDELDLDEFLAVMDEFVDNLRAAEPLE